MFVLQEWTNKIYHFLKFVISRFPGWLKFHRKAAILFAAFLIFLFYPIKDPLVRSDYSRIITDRNGAIMRVFLTKDQQYCLPPEFCDTVPEKLSKAVIFFEDKYFRYHPGVNPVSMFRAFIQNINNKKVVSGASTITMQVARIRKNRNRTLFNKLLEIGEAFRIEAHYSKTEILKTYLDHAPYGSNIIGFQAASWRYFGKPPQQMSWAEACLLAVLPNSPGQVNPIKNQNLLLEKRNRLLTSLLQANIIDSLTCQNSVSEPMPGKVLPFDLAAPHLTLRLHRETPDRQPIIRSSIDLPLQSRANYLVQRYARTVEHYGIQNAAAIIIDNKTRKVIAYVGSQDFYGTAGNVDGVTAMRSSGSLLKPFLYALAIQDGLILPQTVIQDIPSYYGTFSPSNASEHYSGIVTAHEALVNSLNVPAVRLLYSYGHYRFYKFLKDAGISTLFRPADSYGLPLIIGGAEVKLEEISALYCGLANLGNFGPLSYREDEQTSSSITGSLIDTLSVVLCLNILKDLHRPDAAFYWDKFNNQYPVAWKTGTSYGHKDAWAVGVNPDFTVGVWVGNFNASSNKNLSGAGSAGPLMFDLFDILPHKSAKVWWNYEDFTFASARLCDVTGFLATNNCPVSISARAPRPDILKNCPYHLRAETDKEGIFRVCSRCWQEGHRSMSYLSYPPLVLYYLRQYGSIIERIPPHNPNCPVNRGHDMIQIEYPKAHSKLMVTRDFDGKLQPVVFSAAHQLPGQNMFWYLDDRYLGMTRDNHKIAEIPSKGSHVLTVIDSYGNMQKIDFFATRTEQ